MPDGEVGELLLRGPHVCLGYWNNPEATAAALDAEGWFHTGDLARRDADGFFTIAGRKKDMFISGGVNVYPAEIEGELLLHPAVQDAAVIGVPDPTWGEVGVAFVVPRGDPPTAEELAAFLAERLAKYKIPKRVRLRRRPPAHALRQGRQGGARGALGATARESGTRPVTETPSPCSRTGSTGGARPLLLLNGGMMTIVSWDGIAASLAERYRVVRCDFRGQLRSPGDAAHGPRAPRRRRRRACSTTWGSSASTSSAPPSAPKWVCLLAALHPKRVVSLVAATATDVATPLLRDGRGALQQECRNAAAGHGRDRLLEEMQAVFYSPAYVAAHRRELAERAAQIAKLPDWWFAGAADLLASLENLDLRRYLAGITCPVLVLAAGEDRVMPPEHARALAAAIPAARLEVVEGSGHVLVVEQPERFVEICLEFLAGVQRYG